jgi:hypothetical protein
MKYLLIVTLTLLSFATVAQKKKTNQTKAALKPSVTRADSLFNAGSYKDASVMYEAVLKDPANILNARLRFALARNYAALNEVDKAFIMLDSAIAKGFANHKILETDTRLGSVRNDTRYNALHDRVIAAAYPCLSLPEAHAFDFWLGDWDVYATANPSFKTGFNRITRASKGCVILENWESTGPHQGMSINYLDPVDRKWKQKWAGSARDITEFFDGEYVDNAMRFKFIGRDPDGTPFSGRLTFTNMEPGKVRQHSERTDDGGKTWQTIYDFTYILRAETETP